MTESVLSDAVPAWYADSVNIQSYDMANSDGLLASVSCAGIYPAQGDILGIFALVAGCLDECWPQTVRTGPIADVLVHSGFCPDADTFYKASPAGYGGKPTVLTLLTDPHSKTLDPSRRVYACLAPAWSRGEKRRVLCLVSRVPAFDLYFDALQSLAVQDTLLEGGSDPATLSCPRALELLNNCTREEVSQISAQCVQRHPEEESAVVLWAVDRMLDSVPHFIGEPLLRLLEHAMLERQLLLVGTPQETNAVSLAIKAALHPFRWLHLFQSAPVPTGFDMCDLETFPFPMIACAGSYPEQLAINSGFIIAELGGSADYALVKVLDCLGISGASPCGIPPAWQIPQHARCAQAFRRVMRRWKRGECQRGEVLVAVLRGLQDAVQEVAGLCRDYAKSVVPVSSDRSMGEELVGAVNRARFSDWLGTRKNNFLERFIETQMSVDFLGKQVGAESLCKKQG